VVSGFLRTSVPFKYAGEKVVAAKAVHFTFSVFEVSEKLSENSVAACDAIAIVNTQMSVRTVVKLFMEPILCLGCKDNFPM
jgi:hypothetical protein